MTIFATQSYTFAVLNGVQTQIPIAWRFFANSDLELYLDGTFTTAYTVTGAGNPTGGVLSLYAAPQANTVAFLRRVTARAQALDYQASDPFDAESHEAALDRLTAQVQDLLEELSRRPALAVPTPAALRFLVWPQAANLKLIGWNANGSGITLYNPAIVQVSVDPVTGLARGKVSRKLTANPGSYAPLTSAALGPAGARILALTYRVHTAFDVSQGLSGVDVGGLGLQDGWGQDLGIAAAYVSNAGCFRRGDQPICVNGEDITLTPKGGAWGATGKAILTCHWETYVPDEDADDE